MFCPFRNKFPSLCSLSCAIAILWCYFSLCSWLLDYVRVGLGREWQFELICAYCMGCATPMPCNYLWVCIVLSSPVLQVSQSGAGWGFQVGRNWRCRSALLYTPSLASEVPHYTEPACRKNIVWNSYTVKWIAPNPVPIQCHDHAVSLFRWTHPPLHTPSFLPIISPRHCWK